MPNTETLPDSGEFQALKDRTESQDIDSHRPQSSEALEHDPIHERLQDSIVDAESKSPENMQALPKDQKEFSWEYLWTSRLFLVFLAVIFSLMMATTVSLLLFSKKYNGIASQKQKNYYAWRYGPTAVLVFVNALWRQVDYATKALMPWRELQSGSASVEKTLLLDYINLWPPTGLWKSVKNRHWAVTLTMCGQLLILAVIGISTILLVLEPRGITQRRHDFHLRSKIQLANDWVEQSWNSGAWPATKYYGVRSLGMPYPNGTSADTIIPNVEAPHLSSPLLRSTIDVEGLKVRLSCQILPIRNASTLHLRTVGSYKSLLADINQNGCYLRGATLASTMSAGYENTEPDSIDGPRFQAYSARANVVQCNSSNKIWGWGQEEYKNSTQTKIDGRILLSLADWRGDSHEIQTCGEDHKECYIDKMTAALCKPSHELALFKVQTSGGESRPSSMTPLSTMKPLEGLSDTHLAHAVLRSLDFFNGHMRESSLTGRSLSERSGFVVTMAKQDGAPTMMPDNRELSELLENSEAFVKAAEELFSGVAIQLLQDLIIEPFNSTQSGIVTLAEDRLVVATIPASLMCASFILLTIIATTLSFMGTRTATSFRFGTIFSVAAFLPHSPGLNKRPPPPAVTPITGLRHRIAKSGYFQNVNRTISRIKTEDAWQLDEAKEETNSTRYWHPAPSTNWFLSLAASLPLALIVLLEVIQQLSNKNKGFVDFVPAKTLALATYIPTTMALCLSSLFSSLELTVYIFAPFLTLREGSVAAVRSINLRFVGRPWPHAAYLAIMSRNLAMLSVLPTNPIGSLLAIIMSGLYNTIDVPQEEMITLLTTDNLVLDRPSMFGLNYYHKNSKIYERAALSEYIEIDETKGSFGNLVNSSNTTTS
ncbi:hypothetical protein HJFPF1_10876 [Paramyrothecium foliicola]|nr:hypothetical protein HJFPF1_10876 [Paramyrothecium foliicola]